MKYVEDNIEFFFWILAERERRQKNALAWVKCKRPRAFMKHFDYLGARLD